MARGRARPYLWIGFSALACLVGALMLLTAPALYADERAYERALVSEPCRGTTRDCVRVVAATIERTEVRRRKSDDYLVWLVVEDTSDSRVVELPVPDAVFPALRPGLRVDVWIWDGDVTRIGVAGVGVADTENSPSVRSVELPLAGSLGVVWGAFGFWHGLVLRRGGDTTLAAMGTTGRAAVGRVLIALMAGTTAGFFQVVSFDAYSIPGYVATTVGVAALCWVLLAYANRRRAGRD